MLGGGFTEESLEVLNFQRCERPNGTFYGTGGTCRKGSPVGAKEHLTVGMRVTDTSTGKIGYVEKLYEKSKVALMTGEDGTEWKAVYSRLEKVEVPIERLEKIAKKNLPYAKSVDVSTDDWGEEAIINAVLKDGTLVRSSYHSNGEYDFSVNDSLAMNPDLTPRQKVAIALTAKRSFDAIVDFVQEGSPFMVAPYKDDGNSAQRAKAFKKIGFVTVPGSGGEDLIGMKKNGKFSPPSAELLEEAADSFSESPPRGEKELVRLWLQILWG